MTPSKTGNRFFTKHAKSSAALVSLGIHALLVVIALSFVAVTVIQKEEKKFEAKPVNRPKMTLKKLQVPVNVKKKKVQKPKLRKRIVVQPKMNQTMPDIKMPEISGVKGGLGGGVAGGIGGGGGVGFSMPEIEIFGIKGKGEKIFLILDTTDQMLVDEMGGIPAYTIIKDELLRIVDELPATALFNICVTGNGGDVLLFPSLVSANQVNANKARSWLNPLNASAQAVRSGSYGISTLGSGGKPLAEDMRIGRFAEPVKKGGQVYSNGAGNKRWFAAVMAAHQQQADTIFILTNEWGHQRAALNDWMPLDEWKQTTSDGKKWAEAARISSEKLAEENRKRAASGQPPKVIAHGEWGRIVEYFPDITRPPQPDWYFFEPREYVLEFMNMREAHRPTDAVSKVSLRKKNKKLDFSLHVIQFVRTNGQASEKSEGNFRKLTGLCQGDYQSIAGLEEIQSYIK